MFGEVRESHIVLVGISHKCAPLEVREKAAVGAPELGPALSELRAEDEAGALREAILLSTCNRTEIYTAGIDPELLKDIAARWFLRRLSQARSFICSPGRSSEPRDSGKSGIESAGAFPAPAEPREGGHPPAGHVILVEPPGEVQDADDRIK